MKKKESGRGARGSEGGYTFGFEFLGNKLSQLMVYPMSPRAQAVSSIRLVSGSFLHISVVSKIYKQ